MRQFVVRLIFALMAGLLVSGCSAVRLGYGNAESITRWWIDHYADMSPEQDALARERLARLHAWHRASQLPDYVGLLRQYHSLVGTQATADDVLKLAEGAIRRGQTLAEQAIPDVADYLPTVTAEQIEYMAKRFADKNAERAKELQLAAGESGQRKARYTRWLDRAEYWFDDLSSEQRSALRRLIDGQTTGSQFWFDERVRRQGEWLELVRQVQRERPPREKIVQQLRDYAARFFIPTDPARRAQARALRRAEAELIVAIHALATPAQRAHARHKLEELIRDFTELSQGGQSSS